MSNFLHMNKDEQRYTFYFTFPDMTNEQIDELLAEIGKAPLLTKEEELALLKAVKEKGTDSIEMTQLEKANMRFVVSLVNQYQHRGLALEELIEAGKASFRKAVMDYDLDSETKFIAFAVPQMRQSIEMLITQTSLKNTKGG